MANVMRGTMRWRYFSAIGRPRTRPMAAPTKHRPIRRQTESPWVSTHRGYWHIGKFFLVQDENAQPGGEVFDTLSVMGIDPKTGRYFCSSFENHGFCRDYEASVTGSSWTISGPTERASITFSDNNRRQDIVWEWRQKPEGEWLPLCDRVAVRTD